MIKLSADKLPKYATEYSAGFDFQANINKPMIIRPNEVAIIPSGVYLELENTLLVKVLKKLGFVPELQVRPRSGLAVKHGITVINSPGTVDADFPNEIGIILINHGQKDFIVEQGDRVAQGVIALAWRPSFLIKNEVRIGGYGSTDE